MTVITPAGGQPSTWVRNLPDTADYTIVTGSDARSFRLESIVAASATDGASFSLWINDGTNNVFILNAKAVAANDYLKLEHPVVLNKGWSLKCKDHTGGKISVTAVLAVTAPQTTG